MDQGAISNPRQPGMAPWLVRPTLGAAPSLALAGSRAQAADHRDGPGTIFKPPGWPPRWPRAAGPWGGPNAAQADPRTSPKLGRGWPGPGPPVIGLQISPGMVRPTLRPTPSLALAGSTARAACPQGGPRADLQAASSCQPLSTPPRRPPGRAQAWPWLDPARGLLALRWTHRRSPSLPRLAHGIAPRLAMPPSGLGPRLALAGHKARAACLPLPPQAGPQRGPRAALRPTSGQHWGWPASKSPGPPTQ